MQTKYLVLIVAVVMFAILAGVILTEGGIPFATVTNDEKAEEKPYQWLDTMPDRPAQVASTDKQKVYGYPFEKRKPYKLIGRSVEGREIQSYRYGDGAKTVLFVGGIHGGYEWNTVLFAYQIIDYYIANPDQIPDGITVLVVPTLNPDGLFRVVGTSERFGLMDAPQFVFADQVLPTDVVVSGRFNAHGVDLNRNFDCDWTPSGTWRTYTVSSGTSTLSEPETLALHDFVLAERPTLTVFLQSGSNGLFGSSCGSTTLPVVQQLMRAYGDASGYGVYTGYEYYDVTGDATDWLASQHMPAFTVELRTHNELEWEQNLPGIEALYPLVRAM